MKNIYTFFLLFTISAHATVRYVKLAGGSSTAPYTSWATASNNLQVVITYCNAGDTVWVAAGAYTPVSANYFTMKKGVKIFGGFAGTETSFSQRNWQNNLTLLKKGSSQAVVFNSSNSLDTTAQLNGFTITGGNAVSSSGGGLYCYSSSPYIVNCTFEYDTASSGGGAYINNSSPVFFNCVFKNDTASGGAAIYTYKAFAKFINCNFINNSVMGSGGAFDITSGGSVSINNCIFSGNSASSNGGGIIVQSSDIQIRNSLFYNNYAGSGGAIFSINGTGEVHSCTITKNRAGTGAAVYYQNNFTLTIDNSIIWANINTSGNSIANSAISNRIVTYNIIDETLSGIGNFNANPLFADAANFNFQLLPASPAINAGFNDSLPSDDTTDLAGNKRIINNIVDIGAYEATVLNKISNNGDSMYTGMNGRLNILGTSFGNDLINTYKWRIIIVPYSGNNDTAIINPNDYNIYQSVFASYGFTFDSTDLIVNDISKMPLLLNYITGSNFDYLQSFSGNIYVSRIVYPDNSSTDSIISNVKKITIANTLPITIVSFSGTLDKGVAQLQWQTGIETNFNHFEVEKSINAKNYTKIGSVLPKGNNSAYTYNTTQPELTAYYRLKIIDNDGNFSYSNVISLFQNGSAESILLYPNPASGYINLKAVNATVLNIYNSAGLLVKTEQLTEGINKIDIHTLPGGVYFGKINNQKIKFVKE